MWKKVKVGDRRTDKHTDEQNKQYTPIGRSGDINLFRFLYPLDFRQLPGAAGVQRITGWTGVLQRPFPVSLDWRPF